MRMAHQQGNVNCLFPDLGVEERLDGLPSCKKIEKGCPLKISLPTNQSAGHLQKLHLFRRFLELVEAWKIWQPHWIC